MHLTCSKISEDTFSRDEVHYRGISVREECFQSDKTHGGGIVMYIEDKINYVRRKYLETPDIESIWIEVRIQNKYVVSLF